MIVFFIVRSNAQWGAMRKTQTKTDWKWRKNAKGSKCAQGFSKEFNRELISVWQHGAFSHLSVDCVIVFTVVVLVPSSLVLVRLRFLQRKLKKRAHAKNVNDKFVKRKLRRIRGCGREETKKMCLSCAAPRLFLFISKRTISFLFIADALSTNIYIRYIWKTCCTLKLLALLVSVCFSVLWSSIPISLSVGSKILVMNQFFWQWWVIRTCMVFHPAQIEYSYPSDWNNVENEEKRHSVSIVCCVYIPIVFPIHIISNSTDFSRITESTESDSFGRSARPVLIGWKWKKNP